MAPAPGRPAPGRRLLAWLVDFAVVLTVAVLLGELTFHRISGEVTGLGLAGQSTWQILSSQGDVPGAAESIGLRLWHTAVDDVEQAFVALTLFAFLYQFGCLRWLRRTLGKALLGLRVAADPPGPAVPPGPGRTAVRAGVTAVVDVGCYALACCLLLEGEFTLAWLCWLLSGLLFLCNAAPVLFRKGRSLADVCAGTVVTGVQWHPSVVNAADRGRAMWQDGRQSARQFVDQERWRRLAESEQAQRAAGRVRQVASSDLAQAAADKSRAALGRAAGRLRRPSSAPRPPAPPAPPAGYPAAHGPLQPPPAFGPPPTRPPGFGAPGTQPQPGFGPPATQPQPGFGPPTTQPQPGFGPPTNQPQPGFEPPAAPDVPPSAGPAPWPTEPPADPPPQR